MHRRRKRDHRSRRCRRKGIVVSFLPRSAVLVGLLTLALLHLADGRGSPLVLNPQLRQRLTGRRGLEEARASPSGASNGCAWCRRDRRSLAAATADAGADGAVVDGRVLRVRFLLLPNIPQLSMLCPCLEVCLFANCLCAYGGTCTVCTDSGGRPGRVSGFGQGRSCWNLCVESQQPYKCNGKEMGGLKSMFTISTTVDFNH